VTSADFIRCIRLLNSAATRRRRCAAPAVEQASSGPQHHCRLNPPRQDLARRGEEPARHAEAAHPVGPKGFVHRRRYLLPFKKLRRVFRGKLLAKLQALIRERIHGLRRGSPGPSLPLVGIPPVVVHLADQLHKFQALAPPDTPLPLPHDQRACAHGPDRPPIHASLRPRSALYLNAAPAAEALSWA
jgi:hypothetical protein